MTDDFEPEAASNGEPFKVGITPTEDGDKVILVLRADQKDQMIYWLDHSAALALSEALIATVCSIEDEGTCKPPTKN